MTEDWNTSDELKKDIIKTVNQDINDQIEKMIEDLGCPRNFAVSLLTVSYTHLTLPTILLV